MGARRPYTNWKKKFQKSTEELAALQKEKENLIIKINSQESKLDLLKNQISNKADDNEKKPIKIFEILLGIASLIVAIVVGIYISKQTDIMNEQSKIYKQQTILLKNQEDLIKEQNGLFLQQNLMFDLQNNLLGNQNSKFDLQNQLFELQNELVGIQNDKTEQQNQLVNSQNNLFASQNKRIDQQTNLQEADRRSSIVYLFSNVLDKIDDELKKPGNQKTRVLSTELISRIASLTQALKPYKYLRNDELLEKAVSPERGQLLSALMNFKLDSITYLQIFEKANFQNSELFNTVLADVELNGINLANSEIINSNISNTNFANSNLKNVVFDGSYMPNTTFNNCSFQGAKLRNVNAINSKYFRCYLFDVDFSGAFLQNSIFNSEIKWAYEFGEVTKGKFVSKKVDNLKKTKEIEDFAMILFGEASYVISNNNKSRSLYHSAFIKIENEFIKDEKGKFEMVGGFSDYSSRMTKVLFNKANLSNVKISNFNLLNSDFTESILIDTDFSNVIVNETYFDKAKINPKTFTDNFKTSSLPFNIGDFYELIEEKKTGVTDQNYSDNSSQVISFEIENMNPYSHHLELKKRYND